MPVHEVDATAAALDLLLGDREQRRCRGALATHRDAWRWSVVAQPAAELLETLPAAPRLGLAPAALGAAVSLLQEPEAVEAHA